jgi:hypothetical protein
LMSSSITGWDVCSLPITISIASKRSFVRDICIKRYKEVPF